MEKLIRLKSKSEIDALEIAKKHFGVEEEFLKIEIIQEPVKGFLGFLGSKEGIYEVSLIETEVDIARNFIKKILDNLEVDASINISKENNVIKILINGDSAGFLIGKKGETLDSIQFLTGFALNKIYKDSDFRVFVDIQNYKEKRKENLKRYAKKIAKEVLTTKNIKKLEYMNPYERRIMHFELQNYENINTYSEGTDPYRRLVVEYIDC